MNKFKFLKISKTKKIRYLTNKFTNNPYIVFLHGFMSDLDGKNQKHLQNIVIKKDRVSWIRILWSWKIFWAIYKRNISKWSSEVKKQ